MHTYTSCIGHYTIAFAIRHTYIHTYTHTYMSCTGHQRTSDPGTLTLGMLPCTWHTAAAASNGP